MKISIGTNIKDGPWGGGNLFAINLTNFLKAKGHIVVNNLLDEDIDIILLNIYLQNWCLFFHHIHLFCE